ncbi:MAG: DnaJ domain-containing protein [Marmoricola sp.]
MTSPTWYAILGIEPDATPAEIKAAWRDATDKFEPGTGATQFRLFNEAADVLLDPEKRAAYDAELAPAGSSEPEPEVVVPEVVEPEVVEPEVVGPEVVNAPDVAPVEVPAAAEPDPTESAETEPATDPAPAPVATTTPAATRIVAALCVLAVASVVLALVFGLQLHHKVSDRQADVKARAAASAVAERALTAVLSYDYRHMDADRDRSAKFLTPAYRKEFLKTFALLTDGPDGAPGGAVKTQAVVTANVLSTAVVDASSSKVRVLVFVNQSSVKGTAAPAIFQNRVVATLVHRGDSWLIDDVKSY